MKPIYRNLYQFTTYIPPMDFTIHEYLLASEPAILFATGTMQQAKAILPQVREILNGKEIKYIFVSHIESDECGGLPVFLEAYPNVTVICSTLGARELPGFGYSGNIVTAAQDKPLRDGELSLRFFDYPAEVHLQNGFLCCDETSGVLYSSDLMLRIGNAGGKTMHSNWETEVAAIDSQRIPCEDMRQDLQAALLSIAPKFIAVGHGYCVECDA